MRRRTTLLPALLAGAALGLVLPESGLRAQEEDPAARFERGVERLLEQVRAAAPGGLVAEVSSATPAELGWDAPRGTSARRLVLTAPSGAERALGLLPRKGRYAPRAHFEEDDPHPALIAIGPDLVVVAATTRLPALTLEAAEEARVAFEQALAPLAPWNEGRPAAAKDLEAGLAGASKATRYPHHLAIVLPLDAPEPATAEAFAAGVEALAWSRVSAEGILEPPTIEFAP